MPIPSLPDQIDNDPIDVKEITIKQFDCPNPDCDEKIDITNINVGTKLKCRTCENVTWLPDYSNKWWQKPVSIIGGLFLSFIIGFLASIAANMFTNKVNKNEIKIENVIEDINQTDDK